MKLRLPNSLLIIAMVISFAEVPYAPRDSAPGPWLTAGMGVILLRRAIIPTPQPSPVILWGCVLTALVVAGDHNLLNVNKSVWIGLILVAGVVYAFWERFEKLWK
jgi:hypothetical protein